MGWKEKLKNLVKVDNGKEEKSEWRAEREAEHCQEWKKAGRELTEGEWQQSWWSPADQKLEQETTGSNENGLH